jgi:ferrous-iron efflux pump FieF
VPEDVLDKVKEIIVKTEGVLYFHDVRVRASGADIFVDVTIHVDPEIKIIEAHNISTIVEKSITEAIPRSHVLVHTEPNLKE